MSAARRLEELAPAEREQLIEILQAQMLDLSQVGMVLEYAARSDEGWRVCCNSACEPCVLALGRAVDAWRRRLSQRG